MVKTHETAKKKTVFGKIIKITSKIALPIIFVGLITAVLIFVSKPAGKMPSFFGYSFVKIQSSSMKDAGFNVGDVAIISQKETPIYQKGDIVVFYKYFDIADNNLLSSLILYDEWDRVETGENPNAENRINMQLLQENDFIVYFHYINDIYVSPIDGTIFYQTIGGNEGAVADGFIRQDYVFGNYVETPKVFTVILSFMSSSIGMVLLVVAPLAFLVLMECFTLIEHVNLLIVENKVFNRQIPFDSKEVERYNIGSTMDLARKVYFYLTSPIDEREKVFDFLFLKAKDSNDSNKLTYEIALKSKKILDEKTPTEYFLFWQANITNKNQKKLLRKLQTEYELKQIYITISNKKR